MSGPPEGGNPGTSHRSHRGAHPEDRWQFDADHLSVLREAVGDLAFLLTRAYAMDSALKLVGDRYQLHLRQRLAVRRSTCSDQERVVRRQKRQPVEAIEGRTLLIDGFNLLITLEAALSGGVLLRGRDGCIRDLSSVHGSYRAVHETEAAIRLVGETLEPLKPARVIWYLDRPISNSGMLRRTIETEAGARGWPWSVEVVFNPDVALTSSQEWVITSDGVILDRSVGWVDLTGFILTSAVPGAWIADLGEEPPLSFSGTDPSAGD